MREEATWGLNGEYSYNATLFSLSASWDSAYQFHHIAYREFRLE
jgi:hypothetical protein